MKAIVFGAGKIARGFIGHLLYLSDFQITFIDVSEWLIERLKKDQSYHVYILGDPSLDCDVKGFQILHLQDKKHIYQAMQEANIAFISVGGQNLENIGHVLSTIFNTYGIAEKYFNFVTCENWKNAGNTVRESILKSLDQKQKENFEQYIGISEAVIMRTATQPSEALAAQDPTGIWVQNYWHLPIDASHFKGDLPPIKGVQLLHHFDNFLVQKMYTNNTSNAVIAYHGYFMGYDILAEAANSKPIAALLDKVYVEINETLIQELNLDQAQQEEFAKQARAKYTDWTIVDRIIRHGKDPIRKLGPQDRLIAPARMALKHNIYPEVIINTIALAMYFDEVSDESAQKLKKMRIEYGIDYILQHVCMLDEEEVLYKEVKKAVKNLKAKGLLKGHE